MTEFIRIESRRLILRHFKDSDLEPFLAYRNDPEVARHQSWDLFGREDAVAFIREMRQSRPGTPGEWFQFAVELKESGTLAGDCALKIEQGDHHQAEIGYTFSREHQGKGYAAEAVSRLLEYAFCDLKLHRVVAITDQENSASVALLERLGLRREGCFVESFWSKGRWTSEYLYAVLETEWTAKRNDAR